MNEKNRRPNTRTLAELCLRALEQGRVLYDDAVVLRNANKLSSAYALLGLAADELGKHVMVASFAGTENPTDEQWKKFWRRFRRHEEKLGNSLLGAWAGDLDSNDPPPDVASFHASRLASTYVDLAEDGTVSAPSEYTTRPMVDRALESIGRELDFMERAIGYLTVDQLVGMIERARTQTSPLDPSISGRNAIIPMVLVRAGFSVSDAARFARSIASAMESTLPDLARPNSES